MNEIEMEEKSVEGVRFTMGKSEKLRHRTLVEGLFSKGETLYEYPLRLTWRIMDVEEMESSFRTGLPPRLGRLQMMITVPKKKLRHAVDRVLMRRRIREAYRLNRIPLLHSVLDRDNIYLELAFIYLHKDESDYFTIEKKMKRLLSKLEDKLKNIVG
ncbi:MAG: ribonuclease P protein component [Bacteroidales bacterium]|nr:ribonuclease P protein component [Bacteroidales bacterium]MBD5205223.1 ribonuclease P protein component [Bacteroidales bacterium]MBD5224170.1 ribonuclease P protein component [Bacteroidales bacterium]MBD5301992.1 ribonuclease P protein component [Bacteroides sp.]